MNALSINGDQTKTSDAGRGSPTRCGDVKRQSSTYEHRQTRAARSGPSIRLGWSSSLNDINELRRVGLSGADARAASFNLQVGHQLAVQAISADAPRIHSSSSSVRRRLDSHDANEKGLTHAQILFAPGAKADD